MDPSDVQPTALIQGDAADVDRADLGARFPALLWIVVGFLVAGAVLMAGGALPIRGAIRNPSATSRREE